MGSCSGPPHSGNVNVKFVTRVFDRFALLEVARELVGKAGLSSRIDCHATLSASTCFVEARGGLENREETKTVVACIGRMMELRPRIFANVDGPV